MKDCNADGGGDDNNDGDEGDDDGGYYNDDFDYQTQVRQIYFVVFKIFSSN